MDENIISSQANKQKGLKKTWAQPEIEVISKDTIQSGDDRYSPEGMVLPTLVPAYAS